MRIADDAALGAAEGDVDHGAFPGHPGGQRAHFVERDIGRKADAAFAGSARDGMLHPIAGENFQPAVVKQDRDVNGDLLGGRAQDLAHAVVKIQMLSGFVEARLSGDPRILFLLERESGGQRSPPASL